MILIPTFSEHYEERSETKIKSCPPPSSGNASIQEYKIRHTIGNE